MNYIVTIFLLLSCCVMPCLATVQSSVEEHRLSLQSYQVVAGDDNGGQFVSQDKGQKQPLGEVRYAGPMWSSSTGKCLDNWGVNYNYMMLSFNDCDDESETQQWLILSNGLLIQQSSGLCTSYYSDWTNMMITSCDTTDPLQIWEYQLVPQDKTRQDNYIWFINTGYTSQEGQQQCITDTGGSNGYAELSNCDSSQQNQLFTMQVVPWLLAQSQHLEEHSYSQ